MNLVDMSLYLKEFGIEHEIQGYRLSQPDYLRIARRFHDFKFVIFISIVGDILRDKSLLIQYHAYNRTTLTSQLRQEFEFMRDAVIKIKQLIDLRPKIDHNWVEDGF